MNIYIHSVDVLAIIVLICLGMLARNAFKLELDDSDDGPYNRSGLRVRTDAKTGVQYLETSEGGITPRLDRDGKLMIKQKQ